MTQPPPHAPAASPSAQPAHSILLVGDDGPILDLVARFLRGNGFTVHTARDGREMHAQFSGRGAAHPAGWQHRPGQVMKRGWV